VYEKLDEHFHIIFRLNDKINFSVSQVEGDTVPAVKRNV